MHFPRGVCGGIAVLWSLTLVLTVAVPAVVSPSDSACRRDPETDHEACVVEPLQPLSGPEDDQSLLQAHHQLQKKDLRRTEDEGSRNRQVPVPIIPSPGMIILLQGGRTGRYCGDRGALVTCTAFLPGALDQFEVVDAGNGRIGLKGPRLGKFCADAPDGLRCDRDSPVDWATFQLMTTASTTFVLRGGRNNQYCSEDFTGVLCTRTAISFWETFTAYRIGSAPTTTTTFPTTTTTTTTRTTTSTTTTTTSTTTTTTPTTTTTTSTTTTTTTTTTSTTTTTTTATTATTTTSWTTTTRTTTAASSLWAEMNTTGCIAGQPILSAGLWDVQREVDGVPRRFLVQIPANIPKTQLAPLWIVNPGTKTTPEVTIFMSNIMQYAAAQSTTVVILQGISDAFNVANGVQSDPNLPNDVTYAKAVLRHVRRRRCTDWTRISCIGYSRGGRFCMQLANELPGTFAVLSPIASVRFPSPNKVPRPTSVIAFHGTADTVNPYYGGGPAYWGESVLDAVAKWAQFNLCTSTEFWTVSADVTLQKSTGCFNNADVLLYTVTGAGHTWPGSAFPFQDSNLGSTTQSISATQLFASLAQGRTGSLIGAVSWVYEPQGLWKESVAIYP